MSKSNAFLSSPWWILTRRRERTVFLLHCNGLDE
jgi:antiviral helicase SKI2